MQLSNFFILKWNTSTANDTMILEHMKEISVSES